MEQLVTPLAELFGISADALQSILDSVGKDTPTVYETLLSEFSYYKSLSTISTAAIFIAIISGLLTLFGSIVQFWYYTDAYKYNTIGAYNTTIKEPWKPYRRAILAAFGVNFATTIIAKAMLPFLAPNLMLLKTLLENR